MTPEATKAQPVAIVIPWFGTELKGGAEQQAWQIATRLAARGHRIEVLTTCCRSFLDDWEENHLLAGEFREAGLVIRRFPVDKRNRGNFDDLNRELLQTPKDHLMPGVSPVDADHARTWTQDNINSTELERFLTAHRQDYHAFIFLPYLYGTTLRGLPLVAERAWLQPCLHDESYAYLPDIANIFYRAKGLLFNSEGEMRLACRLFGPMVNGKGHVSGEGIESSLLLASPDGELPLMLTKSRFVLCLGRRDPEKGTNCLIDAFRAFRATQLSPKLMLVLAGPGTRSYGNEAQGVIDLGLVNEQVKASLLHACVALCQPSSNESFSRVLFEAWACGKPTIVQRDCLATSVAVQTSGGGWIAGSHNEWVAQLTYVDSADDASLSATGSSGRAYAAQIADWDKVMERYENQLGLLRERPTPIKWASKVTTIHQILPNLAFGDAISNQALQLRSWLREYGYKSEIFVSHIDTRVANECQRYVANTVRPQDALIYHHSIGSEITQVATAHPGPKCLIYHNITPAEFFQPYRPSFAPLLRQGREEMWKLAKAFPQSIGVSAYNAEELTLYGFSDPAVLPLSVDPGHWRTTPDEALMKQLQDGRTNVLFVGRFAPNKCQHHLVEAFSYYLTLKPDARLILVGSGDTQDPYVQFLRQTIEKLGLTDNVLLPGHITDEQLHAYFRTAHLYWSFSEHEGFCVPLIEAMWFDVPILAFASSAIPETLGAAGRTFRSKTELTQVAALALKITDDGKCRDELLAQQRMRRQDFLPEVTKARFVTILKRSIGY